MSQIHRKVIYSDILRYGLPVFKVPKLKDGDQEFDHIIPYSLILKGDTMNISLTNNTLEWIRKVKLNDTNSLIQSMSGINPYFSNGPNLNDSSSVMFSDEYHVCRLKLPIGNYSSIDDVIAQANKTLKAEIDKLFMNRTINNIITYTGITRYLRFTSDVELLDQIFTSGSFNIQKPKAEEDKDERAYVNNFIRYRDDEETPLDYQGYDSVNDGEINGGLARIMDWPDKTKVNFMNSDGSTEAISIYEAIYRMSTLYLNPSVNQKQIEANLSLASWPSDLEKNCRTYNVSGPLYPLTESMTINGYHFDHDLLLKLPVQAKTAQTNIDQRIENMMDDKPEFMYSLYTDLINEGVDKTELQEQVSDSTTPWQVIGCLRTYFTQLETYLKVHNLNLFIGDEPTVALYNKVPGLEATISNITAGSAYDLVFMKINRLMEMAGIGARYSIENYSGKIDDIISDVQTALKMIYDVDRINLDNTTLESAFTAYDQRLREAVQIQQMLSGLIPPPIIGTSIDDVMKAMGLTERSNLLYTKVITVPSIDPDTTYSDDYAETIDKLIDVQIHLKKVYYDDQGKIHTTSTVMPPGDINLDALYHSTYFLYNATVTYYNIPLITTEEDQEIADITKIQGWMKQGYVSYPEEGIQRAVNYTVTEFIRTISDSIVDNNFFPDSDHFDFHLLIDNEEEALLANYVAQKYIADGLKDIKVTNYYPTYQSTNGKLLECNPTTLEQMFSVIHNNNNEVMGYNANSLTMVEIKESKFPSESSMTLNELDISNSSETTYQIETGEILSGKLISFTYDGTRYTLVSDETLTLTLFENKDSTVKNTFITGELYSSIIRETDPYKDPTYIDKQIKEMEIAKNYLLLNDSYITSIHDNETFISLDADGNVEFLNGVIPVQTREYAPNLPLYDQKQKLLNANDTVYVRDAVTYDGLDMGNFTGSFGDSRDQFISQLYNSSDKLIPSDMYVHRNNGNGLWSRLGYRAHYINSSALRYLIKTSNYSEQILDSSITINGTIITLVELSGSSSSQRLALSDGYVVNYNQPTLIDNLIGLKVQRVAEMSLLIPSEISLYSSTSSDVEELVNNLPEDSFMEGIYSFVPTSGQMTIPITTSRILNIPKDQDLYLYLASIEQPYVLKNGKYKLIIDYL